MASEDNRYFQTFYGVDLDDFEVDWGGQSFTKLLVKNYLSDAVSVTTSTAHDGTSSNAVKFIYPHNIKKVYFLEGVVEGHLTFGAPTGASSLSDYRVTVFKLHEDTTETELATTGVITINDNYAQDDEIVYPFWIDVFESGKEIGENERIGVKIEWDVSNSSTATVTLYHDNDSTLEDFKITLPFIL